MIKKPPISGFPWHPKTLGEKILQKRLQLGLTQVELGHQLKVNDQTVSRWETGGNSPGIRHHKKIAKFFGDSIFQIEKIIQ